MAGIGPVHHDLGHHSSMRGVSCSGCADMKDRYKEISRDGLAVNGIEC
jgi:hypothetical protein